MVDTVREQSLKQAAVDIIVQDTHYKPLVVGTDILISLEAVGERNPQLE